MHQHFCMHIIFEELIRKLAESSNETAGSAKVSVPARPGAQPRVLRHLQRGHAHQSRDVASIKLSSEVGGGKTHDPEKKRLSEIIDALNDIFGAESSTTTNCISLPASPNASVVRKM